LRESEILKIEMAGKKIIIAHSFHSFLYSDCEFSLIVDFVFDILILQLIRINEHKVNNVHC
jgi:hypothetical protein